MPKSFKHATGQPDLSSQEIGTNGAEPLQREPVNRWNLLGNTRLFVPPQTEINRIHMMAGKGGLGKTTIAMLIYSVIQKMGHRIPEIFDLCSSNPSSRRYYKLNENRVRGSLDKDMIGEVLKDEIYPLLESNSVIGDLGGSAEVPFLDFIEESGLSALFGEQMVLHVPIGPLDSVGTALNIGLAAPDTPLIVYLNHRDPELRMVVRNPKRRKLLDELLALPNIRGVVELPQMASALTICSRVSLPLYEAMTSSELSPIERAMCKGAMDRVEALFTPLGAWLP